MFPKTRIASSRMMPVFRCLGQVVSDIMLSVYDKPVVSAISVSTDVHTGSSSGLHTIFTIRQYYF